MRFTKMHGIGNDYIYIDATKNVITNPELLAKKLSDRHYGIGSDGLVLIMPSVICDFRMRMFNPDGTEAEMCGNASRCVAKYVYDNKMTDKTNFTLETGAGIKILSIHKNPENIVDTVTIDMGTPILEPEKIPVLASEEMVLNKSLVVLDKKYKINCISMGNPHCVIFTEGIGLTDVTHLGPIIENHPMFPKKTNVEFAEVVDEHNIKMRVWERGTGETLACGTGACATLVAAVLNGYTTNDVTLHLIGGDLQIKWNKKTGHVLMTGPAETVFEGEI